MAYRDEYVRVLGVAHEFEIGTARHILDGGLCSFIDIQEIVYRLGGEMHSDDSYNHWVRGNVFQFTISSGKLYSWKEMLTILS